MQVYVFSVLAACINFHLFFSASYGKSSEFYKIYLETLFKFSSLVRTYLILFIKAATGVAEKSVLKNFAKFTGKYLCRSLFFINSKRLH